MTPDITQHLKGYDFEKVKQQVLQEKQEYESKKEYLKKEIAYTVSQKERLKAEQDKLKRDVEKRLMLQKEISHGLYTAHLLAARKILDSAKEVENSIKDLNNLYEAREAELAKIRDYIDQMKEEFLGIADRYEAMLEEEEVK